MDDKKTEQGQQPPGQVQPVQDPAKPGQQAAPDPKPQVSVETPAEVVVKFPEGAVVDPEVLKEFKTVMGDTKLSPSQRAQAVVDMQARMAQQAEKKYAEDTAAIRRKFEETLKADPEFGKDFEANKVIAQRPLVAFKGGLDFAKDLAARGLENLPSAVKFLHGIGKAMGEDITPHKAPVPPGQISDEDTNLRQRYNHPTSKTLFKGEPADTT